MKEFKHKISFAARISSSKPEDKEKILSLASKSDNISKLLPKDVNLTENVGFLVFTGESCVANVLNANDDGVKTEEAIKIANGFPLTYVDINHKRDRLCGVVVAATYTDYKSGKELSEDDIKDSKDPFAVTITGIVWRAANPDLADAIESMNASNSLLKDSVYLSWELAFDETELIVMNAKNSKFTDGEFVTNEAEINTLSKKLSSNGGNGLTEDGKKIGRVPVGDVVVLGVGLVENPAAAVSPIVINSTASINLSESLVSKLKELPESGMGYQICDITMNDGTILANISIHNCSILSKELDINSIKDIQLSKNTQNNENKISQADKVVVKEDIDKFNIKKSNMTKIEKFEQLTDENLKEVSLASLKEIFASSTKDLLDSKIKDISADYVNKLEEKDKAIKASQEAAEKLSVSVKDLEIKITKASEDLTKVLNENAQREQLDAFSARMESIENDFDLDDKQKEIVANKVKTLATDADFTNYLAEIEVLLAAKKKSKPAFLDKKDGDKDKETKTDDKKEAKASVEDKTALDDALKNGEKDKAELANAAAGTETLNERFKKAFGLDGWSVVNKRKNRA